MRSHRGGIVTWVVGGSVFMYVIAVSLADEMESYPGGPKALAESVRRGVEALRPLRWPADRLDTLGGYLTYHNMTLFTLMLSIYAAVQGARAVRGGEDRHALEEVLATGWSRAAVVRDRAVGFFLVMLLISLGTGVGLAASMAAGDAPDVGGSFIAATTAGLAAMVAYALAVLVSQLISTSRTAAGLTVVVVTALYVLTNVAGEIGAAGVVRFLSPFHYANASRALVPGFGLDLAATAVLVAMTVGLLVLAAMAFGRRDYGSTLWVRRAADSAGPAVVQRPMLRPFWTAGLLRRRFGLLAWCLATAGYMAMVAALEPAVIDAWDAFGSYAKIGGGEPGMAPAAQYLSLGSEIITPVIAAYVVTQAAGWVDDLEQGRVEAVLAVPVSWTRLVWERLLGVLVGVVALTVAALLALSLGAEGVGAPVSAAGMGRTAVGCALVGASVAGVAALVVAWLRTGIAVTVVAVVVAAAYLLTLVVTLLDWPEWVSRLSFFGALGHPYLEWPTALGVLVLLVIAVGGALVATVLAERSPKVAT